jgi:hypothetical protein
VAYIIEPAVREQAKARLILEGPAGSGKTFTALTIAEALGPRTVLIDTQRRQSLDHADVFKFDVLHMSTHFHPEELIEALGSCSGHDTTIVDSGSSFWSGPGGMIDQVDLLSAGRSGGTFSNGWKEMRPVERKMLDCLLSHPTHLLMTLRTKSEYVVQQSGDGKWTPRKIGLKPEQREGLDYEFSMVATMNAEHTLTFTKGAAKFDGLVVERPTADLGRDLAEWLYLGKPPVTVWDLREQALDPAKSFDELRSLRDVAQHLNLWNAPCSDEFGEPSTLGAIVSRLGKEAKLREEASKR